MSLLIPAILYRQFCAFFFDQYDIKYKNNAFVAVLNSAGVLNEKSCANRYSFSFNFLLFRCL